LPPKPENLATGLVANYPPSNLQAENVDKFKANRRLRSTRSYNLNVVVWWQRLMKLYWDLLACPWKWETHWICPMGLDSWL